MLSVGLTGGIASGKSFAMSCFRKQGACLIDADAVSLDLVKPGKEGWKRIQKHFGDDVITGNGPVDRIKLGRIVFSDDEKRCLLNHLLHPLIIDEIKMKGPPQQQPAINQSANRCNPLLLLQKT